MSLKDLNYNISFDLNDSGLLAAVNMEKKLDGGLVTAGDSASKLGNHFGNMSGKIGTVGGKMAEFGGKVKDSIVHVAKLGLTLAGVASGFSLHNITEAYTDFDSKIADVHSVLGDVSNQDMQRLKDVALTVSSSLGKSASDVAEAQGNLASAGFNMNQILKSTRATVLLATAGNIDLASASDDVTSAIRSFGLKASDATHVVNVYAKAADATNAGMSDMAEAMKYAGPVAGSLGMKLSDVSAAIGAMANFSIKGSMAGTTLRSMLSSLSKPSDEANKLMQATGFSAYDSSGKIKSMAQIIGDLKGSMGKMNQQQKQYYLTTIFGQEAASGLNALLKTGKGQLEDYAKSFDTAKGKAQQMADIQNDTLAGSFRMLKTRLQDVFITNIDKSQLGKSLKDFFKFIANGVPGLSKGLGGIMNGIMGAINTVKAGGINGIFKLINSNVKNLSSFAVNAISKGISTMGKILPKAIDIGSKLIIELAKGINAKLPSLLSTAAKAISNIASGLSKNLPKIMSIGTKIILTLVGGLGKNLPKLVSAASKIVLGLANGIFKFLDVLRADGPKMVSSVVSGIMKSLPKIVDTASKLIDKFSNYFLSHLGDIISTGMKMTWSIAGGIIKGLPKLGMALVRLQYKIIGKLANPNTWIDLGKQIIGGIATGIADSAGEIGSSLVGAANSAVKEVKGFLGIHSPSKKMHDEVGIMTGRGIAGGVVASIPHVDKAIESMNKHISPKGSTSFQAGLTGKNTVKQTASAAANRIMSAASRTTNNSKSTSNVIRLAPVFNITVQGGADSQSIKQTVKMTKKEFAKMLDEAMQTISTQMGYNPIEEG